MESPKKKANNLMNKLKNFQNKILDFLNVKLDLYLTGNEIKIDLNNKNIGNLDISLLSGVKFKNLEILILSHNNITNLDCLKDFNFKKLKKIDLSFNKINQIKPSKTFSPNNQTENDEIGKNEGNETKEKIILNNHIEINLDNNNLIQKEIKEIKSFILDKKRNL